MFSNYRSHLVAKYTPLWAKSITYSSTWEEAITHTLSAHHISLHKLQNISQITSPSPTNKNPREHPENSYENSYGEDNNYDGLYLSPEDVPKKPQDFIPLFKTLTNGGIAILEMSKQNWNFSETKSIAISMGATIKFFGTPEQKDTKEKNNNKLAILEKENTSSPSKKISILIPIISIQRDNPRVLEWLRFFILSDMTPFIELLIVFDGIPDTIPAWKECEHIEKEQGFQILRHYRKFGHNECLRSAFYFARGRYLISDDSSIPCRELFTLIEKLPEKKEKSPLGIFSYAIASHPTTGKQIPSSNKSIGSNESNESNFFLLNHSAAKLLYQEKTKHTEKISEEIKTTLKKNRARIRYATIQRETIC